MANEEFFENFLRNAANYNDAPEYYEDTHDANGNYIGSARAFGAQSAAVNYTKPSMQSSYGLYGTQAPQPVIGASSPMSAAAQRTEQNLANPAQFAHVSAQGAQGAQPKPLPTTDQYISPQLNQNFVIYCPRTSVDVEKLIAYLRRREPALVDFDPIADLPDSQRLMDFISGAAYALGDAVLTVRRNLFLITPDTIDVLKPESDK